MRKWLVNDTKAPEGPHVTIDRSCIIVVWELQPLLASEGASTPQGANDKLWQSL